MKAYLLTASLATLLSLVAAGPLPHYDPLMPRQPRDKSAQPSHTLTSGHKNPHDHHSVHHRTGTKTGAPRTRTGAPGTKISAQGTHPTKAPRSPQDENPKIVQEPKSRHKSHTHTLTKTYTRTTRITSQVATSSSSVGKDKRDVERRHDQEMAGQIECEFIGAHHKICLEFYPEPAGSSAPGSASVQTATGTQATATNMPSISSAAAPQTMGPSSTVIATSMATASSSQDPVAEQTTQASNTASAVPATATTATTLALSIIQPENTANSAAPSSSTTVGVGPVNPAPTGLPMIVPVSLSTAGATSTSDMVSSTAFMLIPTNSNGASSGTGQ